MLPPFGVNVGALEDSGDLHGCLSASKVANADEQTCLEVTVALVRFLLGGDTIFVSGHHIGVVGGHLRWDVSIVFLTLGNLTIASVGETAIESHIWEKGLPT